MHSLIRLADPAGIEAVATQQCTSARRILRSGLTPIIELKADMYSPEKAAAENLLRYGLPGHLDDLSPASR